MAPSTLADKRRRLVADPKASRSCPSLRCDGPAHRASGASGRRTPAQGRKKPGSAHFRSLTGLDFGGVDASLRFWIGGREREVRIFSADPRYPKLMDLAGHRIAVRSHDAIHRAPLFVRRPARPIASRHAKSRASRRLRATSCGSGPVGIALRSSSRIASSTRSGTSPITRQLRGFSCSLGARIRAPLRRPCEAIEHPALVRRVQGVEHLGYS